MDTPKQTVTEPESKLDMEYRFRRRVLRSVLATVLVIAGLISEAFGVSDGLTVILIGVLLLFIA